MQKEKQITKILNSVPINCSMFSHVAYRQKGTTSFAEPQLNGTTALPPETRYHLSPLSLTPTPTQPKASLQVALGQLSEFHMRSEAKFQQVTSEHLYLAPPLWQVPAYLCLQGQQV